MKRNAVVEFDKASPEAKAIYQEIMDTMGTPEPLNVLKTLGNNPIILRGVWSMVKSTLLEGQIPELLKQLILFKISVIAGNEYCTSLHAHAALNLDPTLTYDDLKTLVDGECSANLPTSYPVAIDVVSRAALDPKSVADDKWDFEEQLRDEGFTESEIDELLAVGYFSVMMNMVCDAYEVPWEAPLPA